MKLITATVLALAALTTAGPTLFGRQLDSQASTIQKLTSQVQVYTANINKTIAAVPDNPTLAQQNAAVAALSPDISGLTSALTTATSSIIAKGDVSANAERAAACGGPCLLLLVKGLIWEVVSTVKCAIVKLGLACLLVPLTPLILALGGLIRCLDKVVDGLLIAVKVILDGVLGGLAGALLSLL